MEPVARTDRGVRRSTGLTHDLLHLSSCESAAGRQGGGVDRGDAAGHSGRQPADGRRTAPGVPSVPARGSVSAPPRCRQSVLALRVLRGREGPASWSAVSGRPLGPGQRRSLNPIATTVQTTPAITTSQSPTPTDMAADIAPSMPPVAMPSERMP